MISYRLLNLKSLKSSNHRLLMFLLFWSVVYFAAIFQDFIESKLAATGFYWSDTLLYNTYWLWFIPLIYALRRIGMKSPLPVNFFGRFTVYGTSGLLFCIVHMVLFTSLFIFISNLIYTTPHRFLRIFETAVSDQSFITLIVYVFVPLLFQYRRANSQPKKIDKLRSIEVRKGIRRIRVNIETIQAITANRPYSEIRLDEQRYLHNASLKEIERLLSSDLFIRVHRSTIVNKDHIAELKSRKNGDYDALLTNGQTIRLSRHYRENWDALLIH